MAEWWLGHDGVYHSGSAETRVPPTIRDRLAGVVARQDVGVSERVADASIGPYVQNPEYPYWIAMERADPSIVSKDDVREVFRILRDADWGVDDLHDGNVGILNGRPVLIDYTSLRPLSEMRERTRERIEDGVITTAWGGVPGEGGETLTL